MGPSTSEARKPALHCDKTESVLAAIEADWNDINARVPGLVLGLYPTLASILADEGVVVDTLDGLDVLEHCRRRSLPIVDILYAIEDHVRRAGYRGDRLGLADFRTNGQPVYVFYDAARFKDFVELKKKVALRITLAEDSPDTQPSA